jgi:hypothetical protein
MKYTKEQLDKMKVHMAEAEMEVLDGGDIIDILLNGCEGYENMHEEFLVEQFENHFGEDYFDKETV